MDDTTIRNKIWHELGDAKYGEMYLACYLNRCRDYKKWYRIIMIAFLGGGVFGWKFWEFMPWMACIVVGIMQVLSLIENHMIRSDEDLAKISELRACYVLYHSKLEKLWINFDGNKIDPEKAAKRLFKITDKYRPKIEKKDDALHINGRASRILKRCNKQLDQYQNQLTA